MWRWLLNGASKCQRCTDNGFDEIDTGVGGVTAQKMAEKIAVIAKVGQVLCITHLPQIASFADRHLLIRKESTGGRTSTGLTVLDEEGRIQELMRMTVGDNVSEVAYANAKELLAAAAKINRQGESYEKISSGKFR